jgi:hypothetical protein
MVRMGIIERLGLRFFDRYRVRCAMGLDGQAIHVVVLLSTMLD